MDIQPLVDPLLQSHNWWLIALGAVLMGLWSRYGDRLGGLLNRLPLVLRPAPAPAPAPAGGPLADRPLLSALLRLAVRLAPLVAAARSGTVEAMGPDGTGADLHEVPTDDLIAARGELSAELGRRAQQAEAIRAALAPEPARPVG